MRRRDEMLLPVGHAAGTLINLLVREAEARRILEVGSSYGYSTDLAGGGRARHRRQGDLARAAARPRPSTHAQQLARAGLERVRRIQGRRCTGLAGGAARAVRLRAHRPVEGPVRAGVRPAAPASWRRARSSSPTTCCSRPAPGRMRKAYRAAGAHRRRHDLGAAGRRQRPGGQPLPLRAISTRLLCLPSLRILSTRMRADLGDVAPRACRRRAAGRCRGSCSSRTRPAPRGGCTLMVFTSSGCASSSSSVIHTVSVATPAAISALVSRSMCAALSRLSSMSKSSRALVGERCCRRSPGR